MDFTEPWHDSRSHVGHAARLGDVENMKMLIQHKKPVDVADNRGWRPLHEAAAISPNFECLEELLKHENTNVNWTTHEGETALLLACKRRSDASADATVKLLLQYGADANIVDNEEESPLLAAARNGNTDVVKRLVASERVDVNRADCSFWHPLHEAARQGDIEMLGCLLGAAALLNVQDECGMTPIFTAAQHGREDCLRELLKVATERDQLRVVDIGAEDWATPLMIAAQQDFESCVKILLDYGADPNLQTCDNAMALHMAVQGDYYKCLDLLLEKTNLEPLKRKFDPSTAQLSTFDIICPLHLAVEWKSHTCLDRLLAAGFSPDSLYNCEYPQFLETIPFKLPKMETALSFAVHKQNKVAMAILLRAGASCNPPVRDACHPIIRAMCNPSTDELNILLEGGADVNFRRQDAVPSYEILLFAMLFDISVVKQFLSYGCDATLCFGDGDTPSLNAFMYSVTHYAHHHWSSFRELLRLLLRFVVVTGPVQRAFRKLCVQGRNCMSSNVANELWRDVLQEVDRPSPLKQICFVKIRQHLYSVHGVNFVKKVEHLNLPPSLEEYIACRHLGCF